MRNERKKEGGVGKKQHADGHVLRRGKQGRRLRSDLTGSFGGST